MQQTNQKGSRKAPEHMEQMAGNSRDAQAGLDQVSRFEAVELVGHHVLRRLQNAPGQMSEI